MMSTCLIHSFSIHFLFQGDRSSQCLQLPQARADLSQHDVECNTMVLDDTVHISRSGSEDESHDDSVLYISHMHTSNNLDNHYSSSFTCGIYC
jgi:hypothetical protein